MKRILTAVAVLIAACSTVFAQGGYQVKGVVVDEFGPVMGAAVVQAGTTNGVVTGLDGDYVLTVPDKDVMVEISCIGYATQSFKASEVPATVMMSEDAQFLDEVVVIGYGSQKKKEVTGAVASMKAEDFNAGVKTNPMGLLQGKVAGLNVIKTTSDPTSTGYNIQIRGFSTLDKGTGTSPLFIVDGVPVSNIDNISPDEIAAMDVLKDGSAAAIYGTRGTNGVIIITTKRGDGFSDVASTRVEYSGYASLSVRNASTGMATAEQFRNLATLSDGAAVGNVYVGPNGETYDTDWMAAVCRPAALAHNHNVAIVGSSSKFNYRAAVNFKNAEGIARTTNRRELNAKFTAGQKALDGWLDLQYDLSYMHYRNDYFCGDFKNAALLNPTYPIYDDSTPTGYYWRSEETGFVNPVENMNQKESYGDGNFFRGSVKATVNIKPVQGLRVSGFAAIEEGYNANYWYNSTVNTDASGSGKAGRSNNTSFNKLFELTADWYHNYNGHNIAVVAGVSYQNFFYDENSMSNKGFAAPDVMKYFVMGNGDASKKYMEIGSSRNSHTLIAQFARANYNYKEKYLLSASLRREGSSRFGANHKWGLFPALSAGWRVSGEDFMKAYSWVDDLKVRLGFGVTGNDLGSDLKSVELLSNGGTFWYNGAYVYTYTVSQNVNPDIRWEKKYEYNLGIDYSLLKDRVYGSLDVYFRHTKDLLWDYEVPTPPYQYTTLLANAGKMDSFGVELNVSVVPIKKNDLIWVTTPTISFNRNKITSLSDPSLGFNYTETTSGGVGENGIMNTNTQILVQGEAVGTFYGYKFFGVNPSSGLWTYLMPDQGDGVVRYCDESTAVEGDRQVLGNAQPIFTYGWNNTVRWKNWDFTLFLRGVVGNKILNVTRWAYGPMKANNKNVFMKDVNGSNTRLTQKAQFSDYYLEDGTYMKVDNLTAGYTFPIRDNKYIQSARVYVTGQNLLTLTSYSGMDPEVNTTSVWNGGIDYCSFYPPVATFLLGVNLSLY
ncbi:MAG: SusC/RagA family TonB-linked outer membrane protein [Bacteroidales bacterium]|nr:SusC/RagA family TonB-linked outer membrane protein [Bacteroidales bacterium]